MDLATKTKTHHIFSCWTYSTVQLKEILKILEKLNENSRWKWLLHYKENKKLKEGVRVDSIAQKKNLILKSYQSVNIIDLLHYHNCDSPSSTKAEILKCLLNLQIQHISARFAVFLTGKYKLNSNLYYSANLTQDTWRNILPNKLVNTLDACKWSP